MHVILTAAASNQERRVNHNETVNMHELLTEQQVNVMQLILHFNGTKCVLLTKINITLHVALEKCQRSTGKKN